jgi:hypothetical protein
MLFVTRARWARFHLVHETRTALFAVIVGALGWLFLPATPAHAVPPGLASWRTEHVNGHQLPDPTASSPTQVAQFFAGLGPAQQQRLAIRYPQIVGNLDGAPLALRYTVNAHESGWSTTHQLLGYDRTGDGEAAEVVGDLATADRIAVLIPGVGSTLDNFERARIVRRAPVWQARQLYGQATAQNPTARVAVIAWLGYDPPEGIGRAAIREERARAGATALVRFVAGLTVGRPGATIAIIGHSYGSVVAGLAAPFLARAVHDIVVVGSPGMGVDTVAELRTHARVWAGSAEADWTRNLPGVQLLGAGHGRQPADPAFNARYLPARDVSAHDGYFVPGTDSLQAMAEILLGVAADATSRS